MLKVKICGITRSEDALKCAEKGAWAIGFIFAEESPRYIDPERARDIAEDLRHSGLTGRPLMVGVFVNKPKAYVDEIRQKVGLDMVQLHGDEGLEEIKEIGPDIVACHLQGDEDLERGAALKAWSPCLLVDSRSGDQRGGTGLVADWNLARKIKSYHPQVILAGGIGAHNIESAQKEVAPFAFDLSSSVESAPGIKSHSKLDELFHIIGRYS